MGDKPNIPQSVIGLRAKTSHYPQSMDVDNVYFTNALCAVGQFSRLRYVELSILEYATVDAILKPSKMPNLRVL